MLSRGCAATCPKKDCWDTPKSTKLNPSLHTLESITTDVLRHSADALHLSRASQCLRPGLTKRSCRSLCLPLRALVGRQHARLISAIVVTHPIGPEVCLESGVTDLLDYLSICLSQTRGLKRRRERFSLVLVCFLLLLLPFTIDGAPHDVSKSSS